MAMKAFKVNTEWASALRDALVLRRQGQLDKETDSQLGAMYVNVTRWAIATMVSQGKLFRDMGLDPDFFSEMLVWAIRSSDKADLTKDPEAILIYMKNSVMNAVKAYLRSKSRLKRKGTLVDLSEIAEQKTDLFGNPIND
jgi:hypothetical protein